MQWREYFKLRELCQDFLIEPHGAREFHSAVNDAMYDYAIVAPISRDVAQHETHRILVRDRNHILPRASRVPAKLESCVRSEVRDVPARDLGEPLGVERKLERGAAGVQHEDLHTAHVYCR